MKKIISALTLTALALGVASADPKFALNYRTQMVGFSRLVAAPAGSDAAVDENVNYWLQQIKGWNSASDTVSMTASTDYAGITVRIDPLLDSDTNPTLPLQQYNGWVKFADSIELGAGVWKDGKYMDGAYQVKTDSDAAFYNGDLWGAVKPGSLFGGAMTLSIEDMVNFAGGTKASSGYATWTGKAGNAKLNVTGSLIGADGTAMTWDEEETICTGFGARFAFDSEAVKGEFIFKTASNKVSAAGLGEQRAFGLYVMPKIQGLELSLGGAAGINNSNLTEANFDLRMRKVLGNASFTLYTNVSHITNENDYVTDISKHLGAEYLIGSTGKAGTVNNTFVGVHSGQNYATVMWNMLGARVKLMDNLFFLFSAGDNISLDNLGKDEWTGAEVFAAPGLQIMNKKSGIAAYCRVGMSNLGVKDYNKGSSENEIAVMVPVVVRVRF